jgi:hypothetical protein
MGQIRETLRLDCHLVMVDMGGLPDADVRDQLERFGADVVPHVRAL